MIKFSEIFNEKVVPNQLYHVTTLRSLFNIIDQGGIKLNFSNVDKNASWEANLNQGKYFYFSMSHQKYGRYAHGSGGEKIDSKRNAYYNVNLVMNSDALKSEGKLIEVDYWGHDKYSNDEKEVRFISDTQTLTPLEKYIDEIHIYYNPNISGFDNEKRESFVKKLLTLKDKTNVPLYFYDNSAAYRVQIKAKSKTVEEIIPRDMKVNREKNRYKSGDYAERDVKVLVDLLKGDYDKNNKNHNRILNYIKHYPRDFDTQVGADLHNARSRHPESLQELVNILKKYRLSNLEKIRKFLANLYGIKTYE